MTLIATELNGKIYHVHPVYTSYGVSFDGEILNLISQNP